MTTPAAPTISEITSNPLVIAALDDAWIASYPNDPLTRHEEGGWIYLDPTTADWQVRRTATGGTADLDVSNPPLIPSAFVVATSHTHPNPAAEGWLTGPSDSDTQSAWLPGVPCIIRAEDGIHTTGPDSRRGGLAGNPGFPD